VVFASHVALPTQHERGVPHFHRLIAHALDQN
jgi:hypothetical protein